MKQVIIFVEVNIFKTSVENGQKPFWDERQYTLSENNVVFTLLGERILMKALFRSQHYILTLVISVCIQSKLLRYNKFYNFNVEWAVSSKIILAIAIQKNIDQRLFF